MSRASRVEAHIASHLGRGQSGRAGAEAGLVVASPLLGIVLVLGAILGLLDPLAWALYTGVTALALATVAAALGATWGRLGLWRTDGVAAWGSVGLMATLAVIAGSLLFWLYLAILARPVWQGIRGPDHDRGPLDLVVAGAVSGVIFLGLPVLVLTLPHAVAWRRVMRARDRAAGSVV